MHITSWSSKLLSLNFKIHQLQLFAAALHFTALKSARLGQAVIIKSELLFVVQLATS